jgi:hypothetical protein
MMKKIHMLPVLASLLVVAACAENGPVVDARPSVRFVNATTGLPGNVGFTMNGQFVSGVALAPGQATQTCSRLDAGTTAFGFGAVNAGGTGLSGNQLASTDNQNLQAGGDYTAVATGPAANPTLFVFVNSFSGQLGSNQAAVRYVNLAPTTPGGTVYNYVVFIGALGGSTPVATNLAFGIPTGYSAVASGATTFSVLQTPGHTTIAENSPATLEAGTANTMAIVPNASGGLQLIHLTPCS